MVADAPFDLSAAAIEVAVRLKRAMIALGHRVSSLAEIGPCRTDIRIYLDDADPEDDRLGLSVAADSDSAGRLARIRIECNVDGNQRCWFGGSPDPVGFADYGMVAMVVHEEVVRHG